MDGENVADLEMVQLLLIFGVTIISHIQTGQHLKQYIKEERDFISIFTNGDKSTVVLLVIYIAHPKIPYAFRELGPTSRTLIHDDGRQHNVHRRNLTRH